MNFLRATVANLAYAMIPIGIIASYIVVVWAASPADVESMAPPQSCSHCPHCRVQK